MRELDSLPGEIVDTESNAFDKTGIIKAVHFSLSW
jgi:hypothetical protein